MSEKLASDLVDDWLSRWPELHASGQSSAYSALKFSISSTLTAQARELEVMRGELVRLRGDWLATACCQRMNGGLTYEAAQIITERVFADRFPAIARAALNSGGAEEIGFGQTASEAVFPRAIPPSSQSSGGEP